MRRYLPAVRRYAPAVVMFALVILHIAFPVRIQIDWQSVVLIAASFALLYAPELSTILPLIKRLKIGIAEIEMRESLQKLHEDVEEAETAPTGRAAPVAEPSAESIPAVGESVEDNILALAVQDKEAALLRLAIEIEKALSLLYRNAGLGDKPPRTIQETVKQLVSKQILPPTVGDAIIEFRNVRNMVIHPMTTTIPKEGFLTSTIDSGLRILRILRQ